MEMLLGFLAANWASVLLVVLFVGVCVVLFKNGYRQNVYLMCLMLVNQAEYKFGSGTGEIKYQWVVEHLYKLLPKIVTMLFSEDDLDNAIEMAVDEMQEWLENQTK